MEERTGWNWLIQVLLYLKNEKTKGSSGGSAINNITFTGTLLY